MSLPAAGLIAGRGCHEVSACPSRRSSTTARQDSGYWADEDCDVGGDTRSRPRPTTGGSFPHWDGAAMTGFAAPRAAPRGLREADVFGARSLRTLPSLEGHRLPFAKLVEPRAAAGRLVKEVLGSIAGCDKAEALVGQTLDRSIHRRHRCLAFVEVS